MLSKKFYKAKYEECLGSVGESGFVEQVTPPLIYVSGLPGVRVDEVVYFETGDMGLVRSLGEGKAEVLIFSRTPVPVGTQVSRSGEILKVPVGWDFLGNSVDALGISVYPGLPSPHGDEHRVIDDQAPGIDVRERITRPFITGVTVVDLMSPLGVGQRELIIGDRKTGKTEFLLQTMLTQSRLGTICIYAGIGKKKADIKKVESFVHMNGLRESTVIVSSSSTDPQGMIFIAPYTAMTLAEYYRDLGKDVLLILDDLSNHAKFYREISLIGKRFPGRNSYPGDVFYTHARLLERAGNFNTPNGVKAITCLPVIDTVESDVSGFIQTNAMSITDGHIYFDNDLFEQGRRPSVNYFLSVTRVGKQTQTALHSGINRELSSFLSLLEKTQRYIHFGAEVNEGIRSTLAMGERVLTLFSQHMGTSVPINLQMFLFCLIWAGMLGNIDTSTLSHTLGKAASLYSADESFRNMVDKMITETDDFNVLLGKISSQSNNFMGKLGVK